MNKINAKILADSIDTRGNRITTYLLTYPRFIHSELMTHRMFSRNSASSRAIPFEKMVKMVEEDPFIPIAWQRDHKGMQGNIYFPKKEEFPLENITNIVERKWLIARDRAVEYAKELNSLNITKQICNRLLEPFMWHTVLVTATEYDNFFELRCPKYQFVHIKGDKEEIIQYKSWKDVCKHEQFQENVGLIEKLECSKSGAEIHIQALAESMWDARDESIPKKLEPGDWHIPFGDKIYSENGIEEVLYNHTKEGWVSAESHDLELDKIAIQIATARCARLSYMTFDGEIDYEKDIKLHDRLLGSKHASPLEHCAQCQANDEWYANFKGWQSYRNKLGL